MTGKLTQIRDLRWEEVFLFWYQNEGHNENWQNLARDRGFASWADWRLQSYAQPFDCPGADWALYRIENPAEFFSSCFGGPFRTWVDKYYDGQPTKTFSELINNPELIQKEAVQKMQTDFPVGSVICCLEVGAEIFVIEGMHRACALALMYKNGHELSQPITIAIGQSKLTTLPIVGKNTSS
ncbi:hypothetical protein COT97_02485 [Candidatus Falkowbacteria bacterium CG10_big_fil_rev_8_21_14_0_10_39_11]|uniref:Uncharacterized protein n=1 Tax=Candidatus Falkowbacteria bacterium CG10_big_fil_rev_8_21_14_0_10_39_11 TaxID=1974565 RepID=A0A2H0V556_9BACT|nr:MAG: hypothetical protein COT97_02485 [Candidatus Falkowbacteria bacterium CG10_big_fil_rev_8_21_14_0_10_39_11]